MGMNGYVIGNGKEGRDLKRKNEANLVGFHLLKAFHIVGIISAMENQWKISAGILSLAQILYTANIPLASLPIKYPTK
jgi:hypothetical protein